MQEKLSTHKEEWEIMQSPTNKQKPNQRVIFNDFRYIYKKQHKMKSGKREKRLLRTAIEIPVSPLSTQDQ